MRRHGRARNFQRSYGWITPTDGGPDYFVHYSCIEGEGYRQLEEGQLVSFEPGEDAQGRPRAEQVRLEAD